MNRILSMDFHLCFLGSLLFFIIKAILKGVNLMLFLPQSVASFPKPNVIFL